MEVQNIFYIVVTFLTLAFITETSWAQTNQIAGIQTAGWSHQGPLPWGYVSYDVITQPLLVNPLSWSFEGQRAKRETENLRNTPASRPKRHMMGGMYPYGGMGGGYPYGGMGGMGGGYPYGMGGGYPHGMYGHGMGGSGSSAQASASSHSSSGGMGYGRMGYPDY